MKRSVFMKWIAQTMVFAMFLALPGLLISSRASALEKKPIRRPSKQPSSETISATRQTDSIEVLVSVRISVEAQAIEFDGSK
jgi:hypothetical protein